MNNKINRKHIFDTYNKHVAPKAQILQNTSKHTLKELFQRALEHLPYVQLYELKKKQTLVSWLPIHNSFQKTWRQLQVIPQTWGLYSLIFDWKQIVVQAKANIIHIFSEYQIPEHINIEISLAMTRILLWLGTYYWLTKPWDAIAYKQKFFSKNSHSSPDQDLPLIPHDKEL
jgi:hypothetical protein